MHACVFGGARASQRTSRNGYLCRAEAKINQLIETLDMHKDECIERTFKVC